MGKALKFLTQEETTNTIATALNNVAKVFGTKITF
jgi:hypothetical protein